jgi:ATP-binding cassette subfamily C (CFTR/MRP) protein 4
MCLKQLLRDKTVILTTHQLQYANQADQVCLLNDGTVVAYGSFAHVHTAAPSFFHHMLENSCRDETDGDIHIE